MATIISGNGEVCVNNDLNNSNISKTVGTDNVIHDDKASKNDVLSSIQNSDGINDDVAIPANTETGPIMAEINPCPDDGNDVNGSVTPINNGGANEVKKGLSNKMGPIIDDIDKDLFPLEISAKRRKDKFKVYKCEVFDFSISTKKQTGFTTSRPIRWTLSLEKYLLNSDVAFSWQYKTNQKTKMYSESIIGIEYENKSVSIHIYYYTGVVIVNGDYRKWIENEFPKIEEVFKDEIQPDLGEMVDWNVQELEIIWSKYEDLETAVNIHDDVIQKMMERAQAAELKLLEIEKGFDEKITAITKLVFNEYDNKLEKLQKDVNNKLIAIQNKIDKSHTSLSNHIKEISTKKNDTPKDSEPTNELRAKITKLEASIEQQVNNFINYGDIHEADAQITKLNSNLLSLEAQITALKSDILQQINKTEQFSNNMSSLEIQRSSLKNDVNKLVTQPTRENLPNPVEDNTSSLQTEKSHNQNVEIIMCFDSNGKHIDRKRLWKVNNSIFKRCGTIFEVSQEVLNCKVSHLKYFLINVGCNDLDMKDHEQVFGEVELLFKQIREKFEGVKIIFGEITPRKDKRIQQPSK